MAAPIMKINTKMRNHLLLYTRLFRYSMIKSLHLNSSLMSMKDFIVTTSDNWILDTEGAPSVKEKSLEAHLALVHHKGIHSIKDAVHLPAHVQKSVRTVQDKRGYNPHNKNDDLWTFYWNRQLPKEAHAIKQNMASVHKEIHDKFDVSTLKDLNIFDVQRRLEKVDKKVMKAVKRNTFHWRPSKLNFNGVLSYYNSRSAYEYASLYRIFHEIRERNPGFAPERILDFGSGVGSATWAADAFWGSSLFEYMNIEPSNDMNKLARLILMGGEEFGDLQQGHFYKQSLPADHKVEAFHDLVICAFTLSEALNQVERLKTILALWRKTKQYLVIVENGTLHGFTAILEARKLLHKIMGAADRVEDGSKRSRYTTDRLQIDESLQGTIVAPCPHQYACPSTQHLCHQTVSWMPVKKPAKGGVLSRQNSKFSYLVLKKGQPPEGASWPRLMYKPEYDGSAVTCHLCTQHGQLELVKKHKKTSEFAATKRCRGGDLLPWKRNTAEEYDQWHRSTHDE